MTDLSTRFGPTESSLLDWPKYRISVGPYIHSELDGKFMATVSCIDATLHLHRLTIADLRTIASLINQAADKAEKVINSPAEGEV